jgi:hypothetical protein
VISPWLHQSYLGYSVAISQTSRSGIKSVRLLPMYSVAGRINSPDLGISVLRGRVRIRVLDNSLSDDKALDIETMPGSLGNSEYGDYDNEEINSMILTLSYCRTLGLV